ncbi:hypothetical protein AAHA92_05572 [Salvia divinorum]|uniref:Uncharacterized protein n=1 Tax=Salvia divinorum TaxID=28513 RepID=A0ABD1I2V6_SALDI
MIIATWNVRGMQQLPRQAAIVDFVQKDKIDVVGLLEAKLKKHNYDYFLKNKFNDWKVVNYFDLINNNRILLLWNPWHVELKIVSVEEQAIHSKIRCLTSNNSFNFTLVYGLHTVPDKRPLWDSLIDHVLQDEPTLGLQQCSSYR